MAKKKLTDEPNRLEHCDIGVFHEDPLLGVFDLYTEHGFLRLVINRSMANDMLDLLTKFVTTHPGTNSQN